MDALVGGEGGGEKMHGKKAGRCVGRRKKELEDQKEEYDQWMESQRTAKYGPGNAVPSTDTETVANTRMNKGKHSSYHHPLSHNRTVKPRRLNFVTPHSPVTPVTPVAPATPVTPSTGQYTDMALVQDYVNQAFALRDSAAKKTASVVVPVEPVDTFGALLPNPCHQEISTPRPQPGMARPRVSNGTGMGRSILPDCIVGGYQVKSRETGNLNDDLVYTSEKFINDEIKKLAKLEQFTEDITGPRGNYQVWRSKFANAVGK